MKLQKIHIHKLFGVFDHQIALNTDERITIIHGPNGVGKTTILQLIYDVFRQNFHSVTKVPFSTISLTFEDSTVLSISRSSDSDLPKLTARLQSPALKKPFDSTLPVSLGSDDEIVRKLEIPISAIDDLIPGLDRMGPRQWYDGATGDMLSLTEVVLRYGDRLPINRQGLMKVPSRIANLLEELPVYFIQTQRLLSEEPAEPQRPYQRRSERPKPKSQVQRWAMEMAVRLKEKLGESGAVAASLDRQFPSTLLGGQLPEGANESKVRQIYEEQTAYRNRLMKAGLIEEEDLLDLPGGKIAESDLKVLWFYFRDVRQKLSVFEGLLPKIELFRDIINSRFLRKSFSVDRERGFTVVSNDGSRIPLNSLSSGEQHELVLAYELLFKVDSGALILVDEPELSLHVTWQHKFLDDITRISNLIDIDFLIATHSPSIVHTRTDLMTELS